MRLILQPLAQLSKEAFPKPLAIVVDALDECDNNDDVSLLIRCLADAAAVEHVDLRTTSSIRSNRLKTRKRWKDMRVNLRGRYRNGSSPRPKYNLI